MDSTSEHQAPRSLRFIRVLTALTGTATAAVVLLAPAHQILIPNLATALPFDWLMTIVGALAQRPVPTVVAATVLVLFIYQLILSLAGLADRSLGSRDSRPHFVLALLTVSAAGAGLWFSWIAGSSIAPLATTLGCGVLQGLLAVGPRPLPIARQFLLALNALRVTITRPSRSKLAAVCIVCGCASTVAVVIGAAIRADALRAPSAADPNALVAAFRDEWKGRTDQQLTRFEIPVEIFVDYPCPAARMRLPTYREAIAKLPATVRSRLAVRERYLPDSAPCNPRRSGAAGAGCLAAVGMNLAADAAKREAFEQRIIEAPAVTTSLVADAASATGLSETLTLPDAAIKAVQRDVAIAESIGVRSTPTVVVAGVRLVSPEPQQLAAVLHTAAELM